MGKERARRATVVAIRLNFIVEGQTEEAFANQILSPYLAGFGVYVKARCVLTSRRRNIKHRGGIERYGQARKDIDAWIREDQNLDVRFTTMFDVYGLPTSFPGYRDAKQRSDPYERVKVLEDALGEDISDRRFIPHFQLHEFEALLLSDPQKLDSQFDRSTGIRRLVDMVASFDSPELINDGNNTAPSKRIIGEIPEYEKMKPSAAPIVAEKIGLLTLRLKCKHFGEWLYKLETLNKG